MRYPRPARATQSLAADFDFYLLAMSLAPAFCADGHALQRECRARDAQAFVRTPLTLHGLWPERRTPNTYPRDCPGAALELAPAVRERMVRLMPGVLSGLDVHEWRKHGTCSGRPADEYFSDALDLLERTNAALGTTLLSAAGTLTSDAALRAAADARSPGLADQLIFVCKQLRSPNPSERGHLTLLEVRRCVGRDALGRAREALSCASVARRNQGCAAKFWIADR